MHSPKERWAERTIGAIELRTQDATPHATTGSAIAPPTTRSPDHGESPRRPTATFELDLLERFGPLVITIRWATVVIGLALAVFDASHPEWFIWMGLPLVAYAAMRTIQPLRYVTGRVSSILLILAEVCISLIVVVATDYWSSPYLFCLASSIVAAGFARGFAFATRTAVAAVAAVAIPYHLDPRVTEVWTETVQWGAELLLVALIAGYGRRLFGEAEAQSALARQANDLLTQLNAVAQTLPASLDLEETVANTIRQLREMFPMDAVVVLLHDDASDGWSVAAAEGVRIPNLVNDDALPRAATSALADKKATASAAHGFLSDATSAIYFPLLARSRVVGLIAVESRTASLGTRELEVGEGLAPQAALALDNARWFSRLRTVGADEERTRIARDLHDRVGQSLAFVSFELDRISRQASGGPVEPELLQLRDEIRKVVTEVRDTLYDLRTDVSERRDLVATLGDFVDRLGERSAVDVRFEFHADRRLPLRKERELWRIAQEALTNAARHANAETIRVEWTCDESGAVLEVRDDGQGMHGDGSAVTEKYGIIGMRERAAAVGGKFELTSSDAGGTVVRCEVPL